VITKASWVALALLSASLAAECGHSPTGPNPNLFTIQTLNTLPESITVYAWNVVGNYAVNDSIVIASQANGCLKFDPNAWGSLGADIDAFTTNGGYNVIFQFSFQQNRHWTWSITTNSPNYTVPVPGDAC